MKKILSLISYERQCLSPMVLYKYQKIRLDWLLLLLFCCLFVAPVPFVQMSSEGTGNHSDLSFPPLDGHCEVAPRSKSKYNKRTKQKIHAAKKPEVSPDIDVEDANGDDERNDEDEHGDEDDGSNEEEDCPITSVWVISY
jgi:hypothetical protein